MADERVSDRGAVEGARPDWLPEAVDQAPDVVFVIDAHDQIAYVNQRVLQLTGIPPEKLIGDTVLKLVESSNHGMVLDALRAALRNEEPRPRLLEMAWTKAGDPQPAFVEVALHVVRVNGRVVGCVGIGRDVSQRHAHEAERLASERVAAVGDLAKSAAHKINNPLAILITHLGVMERAAAKDQPCDLESIENMKKVVERIAEATKELAAAADTSVQKAILGSATPEVSVLLPPKDDAAKPPT